jgi:hypothetical protein
MWFDAKLRAAVYLKKEYQSENMLTLQQVSAKRDSNV